MDKNKIKAHFGTDFYAKLVADLETYTTLWALSNIEQIDYYSINCIFKCLSKQYGSCVLKIGSSPRETHMEYQTLKAYNGSRFCKVYEADVENSVLLLEGITPGTQLRAESDLDKRLDTFCGLWKGLHIKPEDKGAYPTYMQWVSRIKEYMGTVNGQAHLYEKMERAEQLCQRLWEKYPGEMLLHGDLHRDNILMDKNNGYRIIDPKGVIGDIVFDIPRFILNEFDDCLEDSFFNKYAYITGAFSKKLHLPEYDIRCLTHVEMCMANCWRVESGKAPYMEKVAFTEGMLEEMR